MDKKQKVLKALNANLSAISTLATLMNGLETQKSPPLHLFHGCARVLIRESTAALKHLDNLDEC